MTKRKRNSLIHYAYKTLPAILLCLSLAGTATAQKSYLTSANAFYSKGDYYSAAVYYEKYLGAKHAQKESGYAPYTIQKLASYSKATVANPVSSKEDITYRIAECYRLIHDSENAEKWYAASTGFDLSAYPYVYYWYGVSLRANKKYAEARTALVKFTDNYKQTDIYTEAAQKELSNLGFITSELEKNTSRFTIQKAGGDINSSGANYAAFVSNGNLYFTSTRNTTADTAKQTLENIYVNEIYRSRISNGSYASPEKINIPQAENMEQGMISLSPNGKKAYLTQWHRNEEGKNKAAIYTSETKDGTTWSAPVALDKRVNENGYSSLQPFVTTDGKYLVFSSDKPGGAGGFDLYEIEIAGTSPAVNLGTSINTKFDEQSPFYQASSQTLVFASNGFTGLGGFDLYMSQGSFGNNQFTQPVDAGYPVNSVKDDIYFSLPNSNSFHLFENAFISSDRSGGCCLQLFTVKKIYNNVVTGKVVECGTGVSIPDVIISIQDTAKQAAVLTGSTDADGRYASRVTDVTALKITAAKESYTNGSQPVVASAETDTLQTADICLTKTGTIVKPGTPVIPPRPGSTMPQPSASGGLLIYFDFDESKLSGEAYQLLDSIADVLKQKPGSTMEINAYTDGKGSDTYNSNLSKQRAQQCFNYLVTRKKIVRSRLSIKANGACCRIAEETLADGQDNAEGRQQNRRVEFIINGNQ